LNKYKNYNEYLADKPHINFFIYSKELINNEQINNYNLSSFLKKFNLYVDEHQQNHDLMIFISKNLDHFNLFIVKMGIALELSLEGIALKKQMDIFLKKRLKFNSGYIDLENSKSISFEEVILKSNELLSKDQYFKYFCMLEWFRKKRNKYVHFAYKSDTHNNEEILDNFNLLFDFYHNIIIKNLNER
jgi:hypothetical protein